jgi:hypothetical protein
MTYVGFWFTPVKGDRLVMKAAIFKGKGAIELGERPDPTIKVPTDAVVRISPGRVFDFMTYLGGIAQAYAAMDERRAIKSLVKVGTV